MPLKLTDISINLPFGIGGVTIENSKAQRDAAWSLYVEYATRITSQPLKPGQGSIREALTSLYKLFEVTRDILKSGGPELAKGSDSLGPLAIRILNEGVRPFLVDWHSRLKLYEDEQKMVQISQLGLGVDPVIDENSWKHADEFRKAQQHLTQELDSYIVALATLAEIQPN